MADDTNAGASGAAHDAVERIRQLNERILAAATSGGSAYLDAYEKALLSIVDQQERIGAANPLDWVQQVVAAQAEFTREMVRLSTASARQFMK